MHEFEAGDLVPARGRLDGHGGDATADDALLQSRGYSTPDEGARGLPGIAGATARLGVVNGFVLALAIVTGPLQARALGPAGRGQLAAITLVASIAPWLAALGLGVFSAREVARSRPVGEVFATLGGFLLLVGFCLAPLGFLVAHVLAANKPTVRAFIVIVFFLLPLSLPAGVLSYVAVGLQSWKRVNRARLIAAGGTALALTSLYVARALTVQSAAVAILASGLLAAIPTIGVLRDAGPWRFRPFLLRRGLRFGAQAWLADLAGLSNARLDQLLMISLVPSRELGIYAVGVSASALSGVVPAALGLPVLRQTAAEGGAAVARQVRLIIATGLVLGVAAAPALAVVIPLAFGQRFSASVPISWILLVGAVPLGGVAVLSAAFTGHGAPGIPAAAEAVAVVVTVVGLLVLLPILGAVGAALVSATAYSTNCGIQCVMARRRFGGQVTDYIVPRRADVVVVWRSVLTRARRAHRDTLARKARWSRRRRERVS